MQKEGAKKRRDEGTRGRWIHRNKEKQERRGMMLVGRGRVKFVLGV